MAYLNRNNVYYKMGTVRPDPGKAAEESAVVAKFEVGPGGAQINLEELKQLARGQSVTKRHNDGQMDSARIDVEVLIGEGPAMFTKEEATEIYKIEKAKADALAAELAAKTPVDAKTFDEQGDVIRKMQREIAALKKERAAESAKDAEGAAE